MYLKLQLQERYFKRLDAERLDSLYFKASCEILIAARSSCRERRTVQPLCSATCSRSLQRWSANSRSRWKRPSRQRKGSRYRTTPLLLPITGFSLALEIKGKWEKIIHSGRIQEFKKNTRKSWKSQGILSQSRKSQRKLYQNFFLKIIKKIIVSVHIFFTMYSTLRKSHCRK